MDDVRRLARGEVTVRASLLHGFSGPHGDLGSLLEALGTQLFTRERTLVQYTAWAVRFGLFELLYKCKGGRIGDVVSQTELSECGADCLLGVMCALGFVKRSDDGIFSLDERAEDYLVSTSPYFIGDSLSSAGYPIPPRYLHKRTSWFDRLKLRSLRLRAIYRHGSQERLENQHVRNLAACVAAVRTGQFERVQRIVDVAGGSGTFSIPFALEFPQKEVLLTDLPLAVRNVGALLSAHGVENRVRVAALNALQFPWAIPPCDGIFVGNFLHGFDEHVCKSVCNECFSRLPPGGMVWLHEMTWNSSKDGPLLTALWHASMRSVGGGRQRTVAELSELLLRSGFTDIQAIPTVSPFTLVAGRKPY